MTANIAYATYATTTTGTSSYPPASGLSSTIPYSDNFNSPNGLNSFYWQSFGQFFQPGNTVSTSGGQLQIDLNLGTSGAFCGALTATQTDLLASSVSCELSTLGNAGTSGSGTFLALQVMTASISNYGFPLPAFGSSPDPTEVPNLRIACHEGDLLCTYNNIGGGTVHDNTLVSVTSALSSAGRTATSAHGKESPAGR